MSTIKTISSPMGSSALNVTPLSVSPIKAFSDNYIWAIASENMVALVDPGDANVCIEFLENNKLTLNSILITHHHVDHTGGINELVEYCQQKNGS